MKAEKTVWSAGDRVRLAEVLPLDTPISVQLEPSSACNFRCHYCLRQTDEFINQNEIMPYELFEKFVMDCKEFPTKIKTLMLARMGEPTLHPKLPEMIALAKKEQIAQQIKMITNGSLLNPEKNLQLIDAGLDVLRISLQGLTAEEYFETCGYKMDMEQFVGTIKHFYQNRKNCKVFIKILDQLVEGREERFYNMFGDICDEISIEHMIDNSIKRDGFQKLQTNMMGQKMNEEAIACPIPFYALNICANGDIVACATMTAENSVLGNLKTDMIAQVWKGKQLNNLRRIQLAGERFSYRECANCVSPNQCLQNIDNIDDARARLAAFY